jgi:23S rRNA pseudouridine1911/1915/1917 synthase
MKVLFDDSEIIVVDKPVGLATANSPRGENSLYVELVNRFGAECFVGVVSRLDKPVSGVVVFGKNKSAASSLAEQFRHRTVKKEYLAIVEKRFPSVLGEWVTWRDHIYWDDALRRAVIKGVSRQNSAQARSQKAGIASDSAETSARVIKRSGEVSLVELQPKTGRRHQLRAQLAFRGCPIVGDRMYGSRLPLSFQAELVVALHAHKLTFKHPKTGVSMTVEAKIPRLWKSRYAVLF